MASVLDGQLTRTWHYLRNDQIHVISLYHDPLTGVRSATLDHEEIVGSLGTSSLLIESVGHRILFSIRGTPGYIEIKRSGWFSFTYNCNIGGVNLVEITQQISQNQGREIYDVKILEHVLASDGQSEELIVWYCIETRRLIDGFTNTVHRRFKDFVVLNSDICENFKGHHLKSSLPDLPEKRSKLTTNHNDPVFLQQRETHLQSYLVSLVRVPHVTDMISLKTFLGLMDKVRETSIVVTTPTLGLTLIPCDSPGSPAVIGFIQNTELSGTLTAGDIVSKVNGSAVGTLTFDGVVRMIKHLPRPTVVHFVQTLACQDNKSSNDNLVPPYASLPSWKGDTMTSSHSAFFEESHGEEDAFDLSSQTIPKPLTQSRPTAEPVDSYTSFRNTSPPPRANDNRSTSPIPRYNSGPEYVSFGS